MLSVATLIAAIAGPVAAQQLPEIRIGERNRVPTCVTPLRLMRFLGERNPTLPAKFRDIATHYKHHGERLRVRWDYAFFQMLLETNYLQFRNARGKGDVSPAQNNFAGIGTTGGGVPGDSFPDVSTGVLGQMQHLVAYSGERVPSPVAPRTREKQDDIIALSLRLRRPVTFRDLAGRWAVDRRYARSIAGVAEEYRERHCTGRQQEPAEAAAPPARERVAAAPPSRPPRGAAAAAAAAPAVGLLRTEPKLASRSKPPCRVFTASYGGTRNVLIRHREGEAEHYTAVQVLEGKERPLANAFIESHARGGELLGEFDTRDAALTSAFAMCSDAAAAGPAGKG
jgi:hypothetical protein